MCNKPFSVLFNIKIGEMFFKSFLEWHKTLSLQSMDLVNEKMKYSCAERRFYTCSMI